MEIIVKIKTNEDFIQSILDEQDPDKANKLFTNPTLKEKFKIIEINNIEVNDPKIKNPVSILDALHLFSFKTPILKAKKIRKSVKSMVGISPTMVLLFLLLVLFLKK